MVRCTRSRGYAGLTSNELRTVTGSRAWADALKRRRREKRSFGAAESNELAAARRRRIILSGSPRWLPAVRCDERAEPRGAAHGGRADYDLARSDQLDFTFKRKQCTLTNNGGPTRSPRSGVHSRSITIALVSRCSKSLYRRSSLIEALVLDNLLRFTGSQRWVRGSKPPPRRSDFSCRTGQISIRPRWRSRH